MTSNEFPVLRQCKTLAAIIKKLKSIIKPYRLLGWTAVILLIASFFVPRKFLDIHLHDTYFVVKPAIILLGLALILLVVWAIYRQTSKILYSNFLTWLHIIWTFLTSTTLGIILFLDNGFDTDISKNGFKLSDWERFESFQLFSALFILALFLLFLGQVVLLLNLVIGLCKSKK